MCSDKGKKASVKLDEIVIYWERWLPTLLVIITHLFVVSSRQRSYGRLRMQRLPFGDKVINMEFERDILALGRPEKVKIQLQDVNLPDNNSVYFRAKQKELISQYCAARVFLSETDRPNED